MSTAATEPTVTVRIDGNQAVYTGRRNAFMIYRDFNYARFKKEYPTLSTTDIARVIGDEWNRLRESNSAKYHVYKEAETDLTQNLPPVVRKPKKTRMTPKRRNRTLDRLKKRGDADNSIRVALRNMTSRELKQVLQRLEYPIERGTTKQALIDSLSDDQRVAVIDTRALLLREAFPSDSIKKVYGFLTRFAQYAVAKRSSIAETLKTIHMSHKKGEITYEELVGYLSMLPNALDYAYNGVPKRPAATPPTAEEDMDTEEESSTDAGDDDDEQPQEPEPAAPVETEKKPLVVRRRKSKKVVTPECEPEPEPVPPAVVEEVEKKPTKKRARKKATPPPAAAAAADAAADADAEVKAKVGTKRKRGSA